MTFNMFKARIAIFWHSIVLPFLLIYCFWFGIFEVFCFGRIQAIPVFILGVWGSIAFTIMAFHKIKKR